MSVCERNEQMSAQDRKASKAWAMRMPMLRTTKNVVMVSNMDGPVQLTSVKDGLPAQSKEFH
jgi:hypothetical protein